LEALWLVEHNTGWRLTKRAVTGAKFHLGLLPVPFFGDLNTADIYVALLNPDLNVAQDYYVETTRPDFCDVLRRNLRQELGSDTYPFYSLDPKWHWTGTGRWWHGALADLTREVTKCKRLSYVDAIKMLARRLAALQLVPYHSSNSTYIPQDSHLLESSRLMKSFVNEVVIPRTKCDDALLVLTRGKSKWDIASGRNVTVYESGQARSASLSLQSIGGKEILARLLNRMG